MFSIPRSYLGNNFNIDRKNEKQKKTNKQTKIKQEQKQNYLSCFLDIHRDNISLFESIRLLRYLSVVGVRVVSSYIWQRGFKSESMSSRLVFIHGLIKHEIILYNISPLHLNIIKLITKHERNHNTTFPNRF